MMMTLSDFSSGAARTCTLDVRFSCKHSCLPTCSSRQFSRDQRQWGVSEFQNERDDSI